jgi:hypothetical protein
MVTSYDSSPSAILKQWYIGPIRDQLNNATIIMKNVKKTSKELRGNQAEISLHTGRNVGMGARSAGAKLPVRGKQVHTKTYVDLKFNYGRAYLDGPNVEKTRGNRAAFAQLADVELKGLTTDLGQECNRQLQADGTGWTALTGVVGSTTTSGTNTMYPYLWGTANRYLKNRDNMLIQFADLSGDVHLPASSDTDTSAPQVVSATTTNSTLAHDTYAPGAILAGDPVGGWRGIQSMADATVTRYEMMGLAGIIGDANLPNDAAYYVPGELTGGRTGQTWSTPESVAGGVSMVSFTSNTTNELQGIDADAQAFWRSYVAGNTGVPQALNLETMDDIWENQEVTEGITPDILMTTGKILNRYVETLRSERRYVNTMKLDGGWTAVEYKGKPMVADKDAPRGRINFINWSCLALFVGMDFDFVGGGQNGEYLHYIENYDAYEIIIRYFAELGTYRRNGLAAYVDIDETV